MKKKVIDRDFEKSNTEVETYESIEELKYPQDSKDAGKTIVYDLKEKQTNDPRIQALFNRSRHNNLSLFKFGREYDELPKRTVWEKCNIHQHFQPNKFRDVQNVYIDKAEMDMIY